MSELVTLLERDDVSPSVKALATFILKELEKPKNGNYDPEAHPDEARWTEISLVPGSEVDRPLAYLGDSETSHIVLAKSDGGDFYTDLIHEVGHANITEGTED